jgi:hypothetical protein
MKSRPTETLYKHPSLFISTLRVWKSALILLPFSLGINNMCNKRKTTTKVKSKTQKPSIPSHLPTQNKQQKNPQMQCKTLFFNIPFPFNALRSLCIITVILFSFLHLGVMKQFSS